MFPKCTSDEQLQLMPDPRLAPSATRGIRTHAWPGLLPALLLPVQPTTSVLCYILVSDLACQLRRSTTPHARFAIEHHFLVRLWLGEAEAVLKLIGGKEHGVRL